MSMLKTGPQADQLPASMAQAVIRAAERHAQLVALGLDDLGYVPNTERPPRFPAALLLELAGLFQIREWEQAGLTVHIDGGLPDYARASAELARRCQAGPPEFESTDQAVLLSQVLRFQMERLAWSGPELLSTDVVLDAEDDEAMLDALAEFLWEHRAELTQLLDGDDHHDD